MTAPEFGDDRMRSYLAESLVGAESPLTVMPQDPQNPWDVRFHDARFDSHMSIRQDRLVGLLDTRAPEAVARGLEYRSAVYELEWQLEEYSAEVSINTHRAADTAMYSGLLTVSLPLYDMEIDVPLDLIELDRPELTGPRARRVIEDRIDQVTGTTADSRWTLITPVGDAVSAGQLTPPAWSPGPVPSADSPLSTANPFTESYLSHRSDSTIGAGTTEFTAGSQVGPQAGATEAGLAEPQ